MKHLPGVRGVHPVALALLVLSWGGPLWAEGLRQVASEGRLTEFEGRVSVSGRFERRQDDETLVWRGDRVCFQPDAASQARLPGRAEPAGTARYFCFSNHRAALQQFQLAAQPAPGTCGTAGNARVLITKYTVETGGNVFDQAWLERVEALEARSPLACP